MNEEKMRNETETAAPETEVPAQGAGAGALTDAELAPWEEMLEAYPMIDSPEKLPEGVAEAIGNGKTPLVAMHEAEIRRLNAVIGEYERRERAKMSAGSVRGTASPGADPVLEILLAE